MTPPQVAQKWGVSPEKILVWIRSGELRAINGATKAGGRPRYLIDPADLEMFETRRSVVAKALPPRRDRKKTADVIEYF
jgi:hypothetical protein